MYTFKYEDEDVTVEVKTKHTGVMLDDLLSAFEDFLRASGFNWIDSIEHVQTLKEQPTAQSSQMEMVFQPMSARGLGPE
jgi:hypothetical protein